MSTINDLAGHTAIVTGASGGLGSHITRALARERMNLVLAAPSTPELDRLAAGLQAHGVRAIALPTDVAERGSLETLVATTRREFGGVDVLVNNAGVGLVLPYETLALSEIEQTVHVNLMGPMVLTRLVLPGMLERGRGHIVNIASLAGKAGPPFSGGYGATKAALIAFTESLRAEYRGRGISASVICPGFVRDAGMYQRMVEETGARAPWLIGTSAPQAVARAVVRSIRADIPETIVNPGPARLLMALAELSPALGEWLARRSGADDMWRQAAAVYGRGRAGSGSRD